MHISDKGRIFLGFFSAIACEVIFGLSYMFTKNAISSASSLAILGWRFVLAFLVLSLFRLIGVIKVDLKGKNLSPIIMISIFHPVLYFIGETVGIKCTTASESGTFIASIPIVSLIASTIFLKKKPNRFQIVGISITLIGVLVTVFTVGMSASFSFLGYLMLALAVISYSMYGVFVEKAKGFSSVEITYMMLFTGAVFFGLAALLESLAKGNTLELLALPLQNRDALVGIIYLGIVSSIGAFFLSNIAIEIVGMNTTSSFIGIATLVSILSGVLILKEDFLPGQIIGSLLIVLGVYIANKRALS